MIMHTSNETSLFGCIQLWLRMLHFSQDIDMNKFQVLLL